MIEGTTPPKISLKLSELKQMHSFEELPHLKTFYKVWRRDFKHLKSPKTCRLGCCDVYCELFDIFLMAQ
jgi:hypothetical protein